MSEAGYLRQIKAPKSRVFRRAFIKRRLALTGLFETDWFEITKDVMKWGSLSVQLDDVLLNRFTFGNAKLVMQNDEGSYNPDDSDYSLWNGYLNQQRTLVKIEAGFLYSSQGADQIWVNTEHPGSLWDEGSWDSDYWDLSNTQFIGIVSGDIFISDKSEVTLNIKPLTQVFRDYSARNIRGYNDSVTASRFIELLRDQTDGSGSYVFRPFFGDTTSNWEISTTSNVFLNLNTSGAQDVIDSDVWSIVEKLAQVENFVPFITRDGVFKFISRASVATDQTFFEFHGAGSFDSQFGQTIKNISAYGPRLTKFYSRVSVKHREADTTTSYAVAETSLTVGPASLSWALGERSLNIENIWIPTSTVASTIATTIFNNVSSLKKEITFKTTFIPGIDILDSVTISYDPSPAAASSLWDLNDWAEDTTNAAADLVWDQISGNALVLDAASYKLLSIEMNLDSLENNFVAREE